MSEADVAGLPRDVEQIHASSLRVTCDIVFTLPSVLDLALASSEALTLHLFVAEHFAGAFLELPPFCQLHRRIMIDEQGYGLRYPRFFLLLGVVKERWAPKSSMVKLGRATCGRIFERRARAAP